MMIECLQPCCFLDFLEKSSEHSTYMPEQKQVGLMMVCLELKNLAAGCWLASCSAVAKRLD